MSVTISNNTETILEKIAFDFTSALEGSIVESDLISHIVIFQRNDVNVKPDTFQFQNYEKKWKINWINRYGIVDFGNKWLNSSKIRCKIPKMSGMSFYIYNIYMALEHIDSMPVEIEPFLLDCPPVKVFTAPTILNGGF